MNMRERTSVTETLSLQFQSVRQQSEKFCAPLQREDYGLQAMPETSPPKWHLAHTTWFFETFVLKPFQQGFQPWHPLFEQLFNSYYNGVGRQFARSQRGLLSRPGVEEVLEYRRVVDQGILALLYDENHPDRSRILARVELGIHHEQQHQELFFTDIKYSFSVNPLAPALLPRRCEVSETTQPLGWQEHEGGVMHVGHGSEKFCYDNETPLHRVFLEPFALANRLITNREYLDFVEDGGYRRPEFWLADAWEKIQRECWEAPLYWNEQDGVRYEYTLTGLRPLNLAQPVSHVSAYEADAFARWSGARLPTESEWEVCAQSLPVEGQFVESEDYHPRAAVRETGLQQIFGTLWEWTSSSYSAYPGFRPATGAIGEYNGKFMCNQQVLRGGSCVSSQSHLRASYRNFFYPRDRWQFSGIRLAQSLNQHEPTA